MKIVLLLLIIDKIVAVTPNKYDDVILTAAKKIMSMVKRN